MRFLAPLGGNHNFGVFSTPAHGVASGIKSGSDWAGDNQAYSGRFDYLKFSNWLSRMEPYKNKCLFIVCPDSLGSAEETIKLFHKWNLSFGDWPLAFVAQDGQELLDFPDINKWNTLFIGGTTKWKMSSAAINCIRRAQLLGKRIHIGRVNWRRRYIHFSSLDGSEYFTCDGTRTRYGKDLALKDWEKYQLLTKQYSFSGEL